MINDNPTITTGAETDVFYCDEIKINGIDIGKANGAASNDGNIDDGVPVDWYTTGSYWNASTGELKWTSTAGISGQCSHPNLTFDNFEAEYDLMADGYYQDTYWAAFAFRKTNYSDWYGTSGYMVYYRYNGWIELYSAAGGVLATSNTGKLLNAWRHVKIVANGASIKVYVDGVLQINATDATYIKGYLGLNVFGVAARYDNLTVNGNPFKDEVYYVRDVDGEILAEYDGAGNLLAEYVSANGQLVAKINPSGTVDLYLNDHLGSARAMVGSGWSANYYPFGEMASQTGSDEDTHFDFTGHERDRGTGLIYAGARFLDPETGRWVSVDPLAGKYPSLSPYAYAANNPLSLIDPDGMQIGLSMNSLSVQRFVNTPPPAWNDQIAAYSYGVAAYAMNEGYIPLVSQISAGVWSSVGNLFSSNTSILEKASAGAFLAFVYAPVPIGKGVTSLSNVSLTSSEGFLFGGIRMTTPFNIPVQRFGANMELTIARPWALRVGSLTESTFYARTFNAILPRWNSLSVYTRGVIPKGTPITIGLIGPQSLRYPGILGVQINVMNWQVINQVSHFVK